MTIQRDPAGKACLAVFDLDGTLVDTLGDLADATNYALAACGCPVHPEGDYRQFVGNGVRLLVERALPEWERGGALADRVLVLFNSRYDTHYLDRSRPYEGVPEMLDALRAEGLLLAVVSNKPHPFTMQIVRTLFGDRFAAVYGHREGYPHKPDPAVVRAVMNQVGAEPDSTVYIGDSNVDVQTGHNAGLPCIGCAWGFRGREELCAAGADRIAGEAGEIPRLIGDLLTL